MQGDSGVQMQAVAGRLLLMIMTLVAGQADADTFWCDDFEPFRSANVVDGIFPSSPPGVRIWNLSSGELLTPTCGQATFFGSSGHVRAIQSNHLAHGGDVSQIWTFVDSDLSSFVRAVDVNVTQDQGAVSAYVVQAWYKGNHDLPGTSSLTAAQVRSAFEAKNGTTTGYSINKLTFRVEPAAAEQAQYACDVEGRNLTNISTGCEAIADPSSCHAMYTIHRGNAVPCVFISGCVAKTSCAGGDLPKTVGWDPVALQLLGSGYTPPWAQRALTNLLKQADEYVGLDAGIRRTHKGPWSVADKQAVPPSGDKRDFFTRRGWPCTQTTTPQGYFNTDPWPIGAWNTPIASGGPCNTTTGLPWVELDGFPRNDEEDFQKLVAMRESLKTLTLAWWFSRNRNTSAAASYLDASLLVFRTWFLNETTRMNPNLNFAEGLPGDPEISDGAATGLIHFTRMGAMLNDCVALLRRSDSWTVQDETAWQDWMRDWLGWLTQPSSEHAPSFGYLEAFLPNRGNHATWMWVHTLAMAKAAGWQRLALEWLRQVRSGFPSALVNQIQASGKMPTETDRQTGAVYSRFALEAILALGGVAEAICRDWACGDDAEFQWDSPVVAEGSGKWIAHRDVKSNCPSGTGTQSLSKPTVSEEACKTLCLDGGNRNTRLARTSCNTFTIRYVRGEAHSCYTRACGALGRGTAWSEAAPVSGGDLFQKHAFVDPPANGSGSVKRAVEYLLPYAFGEKDWHDDHPNQQSWEGKNWTAMGPLLHQAAAFIDSESDRYQALSRRADPDLDQNVVNLVLPVQLCSGRDGEEVLGGYFDIVAGARAGSWVSGRLQPVANMFGNVSSWSFSLSRPGGVFELVNQYDTKGRLFGAFRVVNASVVGAAGAAYEVNVELRHNDVLLGCRAVTVLSVAETVLGKIGARVKEFARSHSRMWGRTEFKTPAEVAQVVEELEVNNGSFVNNLLYSWTEAEKKNSKDLKATWTDAINQIGGLGYAYYDKKNILDAAMLARIRQVLPDAFIKFGRVVPLDARDYLNSSEFEELDDPWLRDIPCAGFADSSDLDKKGWSFGDVTHQWDFADALLLPAIEIAEWLRNETRSLDAASALRAQQAEDELLRALSLNFALNPRRLELGDTTARWGNLLDSNHSDGVWADANQGHRARFWIANLYILQDYNRPITYLPYWYQGFNFTKYPALWSQNSGQATADQQRLLELQLQGWRLRRDWSPRGVFSDVKALVANAFNRKKIYELSGFQPDGFINHHSGGCADTAMKAYGFEWIKEIIDVAIMLRGTPWELERSDWHDLPAQVVTFSYPKIVFKGYIDWAFIGRTYMSDKLWRFGENDLKPVVSHLLDLSSMFSVDVQQKLQALKSDLDCGRENVVQGNTAFWNSDSMVMRARSTSGMLWHASLRMRSLFSHGNEDFADVAKAWHTGSGMLLVRVAGDEYDMVRAKMDWHILPGVTEEWRSDALPLKGHPMRCGGNAFASTVSDGTIGVAAFNYQQHQGPADDTAANDYSTAQANKAYFFQLWGVVAMGHAVRRAARVDGSIKWGQNQSIVTTIDQARWRGDITVGFPHQGGLVEHVFSLNSSNGTCHENFTIPSQHFAYVHQGAVGYVVRADRTSISLTLLCGDAVVATDPAEAQNSKWGKDRRWKSGSGFEGSDVPFALLIDHGVDPVNASYLYSIVPGVNVSEMREKGFPLSSNALSPASILRNDDQVQALVAVRSQDDGDRPHQANSSSVQVVFRTPSSVQLPLGDGGKNITVASDRPAVLMISRDSLYWNVSIAEATRDSRAKKLTISIDDIAVLQPGRFQYSLPGMEPREAVDSVDVVQTASATNIIVGLPDIEDDATYDHRATMYLSAPIKIVLPVSHLDAAALASEEAAILGIRDRFLFLHANASVTGGDAMLDDMLKDLKASWYSSWSWQSLRQNFGCHLPNDPFVNNSGCFEENTASFDFWGLDRSNNAWRYKYELDMLHSLAFKFVSADIQDAVQANKIREFVVEGLASMVRRGLSKETFNPGLLDKDWNDTCSLYFTGKDGNYKSGWSQVPFYQRTESLLTKLVLLFREDLKTMGIFQDIMGALSTFTGRWGHGERWINEENFAKCFQHGMNTDMSRFVLTDRLYYVISLDVAGDDAGTRAEHMVAWSKWAHRAFILDNTISYTFKPDGTMHHHHMIYGNGYPYNILPWAARVAWMLAGSPWALHPSSVDNIARAHRVMRSFTSGLASPRSIGGRLVEADLGGAVNPPQLCVGPLLATLPEGAISDRWRAASIASTWYYVRSMSESFWTTTGSPARPQFQHHGCLRLLHEVKSTHNESVAVIREKEHQLSCSLNIYPYAGMAVFRPGNGDIVAVAKGFSHEVRNSFERNVGQGENFYGHYQSAGTLLISSSDKSVDPILSEDGTKTDRRAGKLYGGMDWYRLPGVTAPHRSASAVRGAELREPTGYASNLGVFPRSYEPGADPIPYSNWAESPDAFVGGVSTGMEDGMLGVFGFRMEDIVNNRSDVDAYLEEALQAYKTKFFFGEAGMGAAKSPAFILALGSDITSKEIDAGPVQTTLFQQHIGSNPSDHPIGVNGQQMASLPYSSSSDLNDLNIVKLQDAANNSFIVVKRAGTTISVARKTQNMTRYHSWTDTDARNYSWAVLEHDVSGSIVPSYEYAVLLNADAKKLQDFSPALRYRILSDKKFLHAVECLATGKVGLLFYRAGEASDQVSNRTHLASTSARCALVIKRSDSGGNDQLDVVFANPELGFLREGQRFNVWSSIQKPLYLQRTMPQNTTLQFKGHWELQGNATQVLSHASVSSTQINASTTFSASQNVTAVRIRSIDGISVSFRLIRTAPSVIAAPSAEQLAAPDATTLPAALSGVSNTTTHSGLSGASRKNGMEQHGVLRALLMLPALFYTTL